MSLRRPSAPASRTNRLEQVLAAGQSRAVRALFGDEEAMESTEAVSNTFQVTLRLKCAADYFQNTVDVDREVLDRARAGEEQPVTSVAPGAVKVFLLHESQSARRLDASPLRDGLRVFEGAVSYDARLVQEDLLRDGGSSVNRLEVQNPRNGKWIPLRLVPGENVTNVVIMFQERQ